MRRALPAAALVLAAAPAPEPARAAAPPLTCARLAAAKPAGAPPLSCRPGVSVRARPGVARRFAGARTPPAPSAADAPVRARPAIAPAAPPAPRAGLPPQGVYDSCYIERAGWRACHARLRRFAAAGFRYVLNYAAWYATPAQVWWYAYAAQRLGLQLIWPLNHPRWRRWQSFAPEYGAFSRACGCRDRDAFWRWAIGLAASMPATWGYYVGDEVNLTERGRVLALRGWVKGWDPARSTLYVTFENTTTLGSVVAPFGAAADVVGADYYPVGRGLPLDGVGDVAGAVQDSADAHGVASALVLQAFSWSQYQPQRDARWPTALEMRTMRDHALRAARPAMLLWYSYQDIARSRDPHGHFGSLVQAAFAP